MYKYKIIVLFSSFFLLTLLSSCSKKIVANKSPKQYYYSCPMHQDYISYQPGKCPKCGMTLEAWDLENIPKKSNSSHGSNSGSGGHSGGHHH